MLQGFAVQRRTKGKMDQIAKDFFNPRISTAGVFNFLYQTQLANQKGLGSQNPLR